MTNPQNKQTAESFWGRIARFPEEAWSCWAWPGKIYANGYGMVRWHAAERYAHHIAWWTTHGPTSLQVLHHCDNKACVRPDHLFIGTNQDNMRDKFTKRRHAQHKLTPTKVREIRRAHASGVTYRELAHRFLVSTVTIARVATRHGWTWVN